MRTDVLIIGGGVTGTGLARDLALRGVHCLLAEKSDINAGASGGNHGLLHSGARYVASDMEAAVECREEGDILRTVAPHCIEETGGLFVSVEGDDEAYADAFPDMCAKSGIACRQIDPAEALEMEPCLSEETQSVYAVNDAAIDPFMLSLDNIAHACSLGSDVRRNVRVVGFGIEQGRIRTADLHDANTGRTITVEPKLVVNAAGAWAGEVAALAGAMINILYSKGTLLVTQDRLSHRVINRLRKASDADILVPGGTVSVLGTTSVRIDDPDDYRPSVGEVDAIIDDARAMVPSLETTRYIRAYAGVRPLVSMPGGGSDDRNVSRGFSLIDHETDGVENFVTITGGKLTTYRLMAEKTADMVCAKLGVDKPCLTRTEPLPHSPEGMWTEPGMAPRNWIGERDASDIILCECEMVSRNVVTEIAKGLGEMRGLSALQAIGLRSRVGKGPCQGAFCGPRVTSHLYDMGLLTGERGVPELKEFLERRWRGVAPLLWEMPLVQSDLHEAIQCGLMELELNDAELGCCFGNEGE